MEALIALFVLGLLSLVILGPVLGLAALVRARSLRQRVEALEKELTALGTRPAAPAPAERPATIVAPVSARTTVPVPARASDAAVPAKPIVPPQPLSKPSVPVTAAPAAPATVPAPAPDVLTTAEPAAATPPPAHVPPAVPVTPVTPAVPPHVTPPPVSAAPPPASAPPRPAAPPATAEAPSPVPGTPGGPPPMRPRPPAGPPAPPPRTLDWERLVGVNLFAWVGGIALVFAAVFFLKYSIEHGWIGAPVRMAIGLATGVGLLVVCEAKAARRYRVTANALDAAGIAILFSTLFAAHALWGLIPQAVAFLLLGLVTAVAVLLSIRRDSVFIALLGLVGGFATPALLSTGADRPIGLFGYLLLLNLGLAWVAYRKGWPALTTVSALLTVLYQWAWVLRYLDPARVPLAVGIFLVFPIAAAVSLWLGERGRGRPSAPLFAGTVALAAALPLLFAVFLAAVPQYGARFGLLFGFLLFLDAGLWAIASARDRGWLHLGAAAVTVLVWAIWLGGSYRPAAWPAVLAWLAAFVVFYLASVPLAARILRPLGRVGAWAADLAPVLLFVFPALVALEPRAADPLRVFGALFVLAAAVAVRAVQTGRAWPHLIASFFALAAAAVWSARHLGPERLLAALAVYALFGLFYLGVPLAAERRGTPLQPSGSGGVLAVLSLGLLFFLTGAHVAAASLWGLALLLGILNLGLIAEAAAGRARLAAVIGAILSWVVVAAWWAQGPLGSQLVPALLVVGGLAALSAVGAAWASAVSRDGDEPGPASSRAGAYLALTAHLFLLFVATRPELSLPPWPLFGVLALVDLALAAAALWVRRAGLLTAGLAASQVVLAAWVGVADAARWSRVGLLAAFAVIALGLAALALARRRGAAEDGFALGAALAVLLAQALALVTDVVGADPGLPWLVAVHLALTLILLLLAARTGTHPLAVLAVVPPAVAGLVWQAQHLSPAAWPGALLMAAAPYAAFLAYPVVLGRRAGAAMSPYLAAALASAAFFLLGREALEVGGFAPVIGILPVTQALLLAGLLWHVLRLEPAGARGTGRVALVAAAALAFVTIAVPLQLDREWITIGWALEAAALAWLFARIPHRGLLAWSAALSVAAFVRLVFNPAVLTYHPRGDYPIWNWYLYTYLLTAAALLVAARFLRRSPALTGLARRWPSALSAGATVLLFLLVNIEIADYYATGPTVTFNFSAGLAQDLTYTLGWAVFAIGLLLVGIVNRSRAARISALVLLVVTVFKCFMHDLWRLGGLHRVGSFLGLAVCLLLVTLLLQRFVLKPEERPS